MNSLASQKLNQQGDSSMSKADTPLPLQVRRWLLAITAILITHSSLAAPLPNEVTINGVEFVLIPEGWFYKPHDNARIWLDSYYIAKYEARARDLVSYLNAPAGENAVYELTETNCAISRNFFGQYLQKRPEADYPATHMSWQLSNSWANWMGFRLPSEAEWEKAARGDDQRIYPWGDEFPDDTYAGFNTRSLCYTWPVDSFKKGVSPYGVYNMAGNVREFVADWYNEEFNRSLTSGTKNPIPASSGTTIENAPSAFDAGPWKMLKGGRWAAVPERIRISARVRYLPNRTFRCNGTRFAVDVATVLAHINQGHATVSQR
ncbi:MAG: SUMF1/EgtB/PvdO family nonheme iron enzyme [Motiliproteus sp.]